MKKYIAGLVLVASIYPNVTFAVSPGVEFLSPLVQTIIQLLQDRIGVLSAENEQLKQKLSEQPICGAVTVSPTPQQRYNDLMKAEEVRIRGEFAPRIADIEAKMRELDTKIQSPETYFECGGYGCPNRKFAVEDAQKKLRELDTQKRTLEAERARQLAAVGVF